MTLSKSKDWDMQEHSLRGNWRSLVKNEGISDTPPGITKATIPVVPVAYSDGISEGTWALARKRSAQPSTAARFKETENTGDH